MYMQIRPNCTLWYVVLLVAAKRSSAMLASLCKEDASENDTAGQPRVLVGLQCQHNRLFLRMQLHPNI